jgi:diaminopimelate decarboxylase
MHDVGAYTFSMWSRYCSRAFPEILGAQGPDNAILLHTLRRRDTPADLVAFWSA